MLFTADHDEPRRILQKFIAAEINPLSMNGRRPTFSRRMNCSRSSAISAAEKPIRTGAGPGTGYRI
jgi:hypothetical protein